MNKKDLIDVRAANGTLDHSLIYSTWLKGLYFSSHKDTWISSIPEHVFNKQYAKVIAAILEHPKTVTKLACLREAPDVILGYAVFSDDNETLHWVYVKTSWRGIGLASDLVPATIKTVTHLSPTGKTICYRRGILFDPFKINPHEK